METRGFKELNISICSSQSPSTRYPPEADAPTVARYRNTLTALSQCRNLLFIAYLDQIHVFKPQFPTQIISSKPELILNLPKSCQGLRGYIDPTAPHAVNHIAVGDLGSEEIVVAVCDDGDVIAYTTRSICDAIEYDISHNTTSSMPANEPKTMLLQNVGMSAWGVAIHKSARLIAVSSNMHQISVFAFALDRKWSPDTFSDLEDEDAMSTDFLDLGDTLWERVDKGSCMRRKRFSRNLQIILEGHIANIPNIAFCNTKADLYGKYLVSTDILGYTYVWDIWERTIIADISSARQIDEISGGWGVACLDPQMYLVASSSQETFGGENFDKYIADENTRYTPWAIYDNSATIYAVADSSRWYPSYSKYRASLGTTAAQVQLDNSFMSPEGGMGEGDEDFELGSDYTDFETLSELDAGPYSYDSQDTEIGPEGPSATEPILPIMELMSSLKATGKQSAVRSQPKSRVRMNKRKRLTLPFHPFTVSKSDIRFLFEVRLEKNVTQPISYTTVLCEKVVQQQMPQRLNNLSNSERMNMVIQIPELSAVVVGNQVGRVALLTMTKFSKIEKHYGFRVDWILPFKSQEDQYQRPECPLMGMAVGPIQGREMMRASTSGDSPGSFCTESHTSSGVLRRYRLFLIYLDHTTLTFEIGRSPSDTVHGFHDGDLVF